MTSKQFLTLLAGVVGGLIFALGMCMCLVPEWDAFAPGVVVAAIGGVILAILGIACFIGSSKERKPVNLSFVIKVIYGILSTLLLGLGMCMIMVWQMMIPGVIVGVVGIIMLLFLIPMFAGFKK